MTHEKCCLGCGASLQTKNSQEKGYCLSLEKDYCQRCFRLTHYNDPVIDFRRSVDGSEMKKMIAEEKEALFIYVVDILSLTDFFRSEGLSQLRQRHVLLLINKIDLLPRNSCLSKIEKKIIAQLRKQDLTDIYLEGVYLTRKNDPHFKKLFAEFMAEHTFQKLIFMGAFNAGKSTLLNYLLEDKRFTTSIYPSTTLSLQAVEREGILYYDSPGSVNDHNFLLNVEVDDLKKLATQHTIKPQVFQLYEDQSYLLENIFQMDVVAKEKTSVIFYFANALPLHRTKTMNVARYLETQKDAFSFQNTRMSEFTFQYIGRKDYEIPGLGFITVHNAKAVRFYVPQRTKVWEREVLL